MSHEPAVVRPAYRQFPTWLNMMPVEEVINLVRGGSALAKEYVAYCDQVHRDARESADSAIPCICTALRDGTVQGPGVGCAATVHEPTHSAPDRDHGEPS